ncbi:MAG: DUF3386 domain-containing protein [Cyanobacteria bacterium J06597_1]
MVATAANAREIFKEAYENRYTWDSDFPGFTADVTLTLAGQEYSGSVRVNADLSYEVLGIEDSAAEKMIQGQLWEMTIHRVNHGFEKTHGENTFELGDTDDTGAVDILVSGKAHGNLYKVRDRTVCFVHRQIRDVIVNIHTHQVQTTEQGYLATHYDSIYLDAETQAVKGQSKFFVDTFELVDGYYVLTGRNIQSGAGDERDVTDLTFSNVQLLAAA